MSRHKAVAILYSDDALLVADKPAGLLSIPGRDTGEISLLEILKNDHDDIMAVHRIDRDTSGIIVFAIGSEAHRALSKQFAEREIAKTYTAIVLGRPQEDRFAIDLPISVGPDHLARVDARGKPSRTEVTVLERFARYSLVEAHPVTGRQHQIRVHLKGTGFPLAVDPLYGSSDAVMIHDIKRRASGDPAASRPLLARTPLHASGISFEHPHTGAKVSVESPLPKDMRALLTQLRKWGR